MTKPKRKRVMPGSIARMITVMIERVVAGEDAKATVDDYGAWEWGHGPDLTLIVKLVELREAVREAVREYARFCLPKTWRNVMEALKRAGGKR